MGKYSKISGNTFYRNFPTRPTYGDPTYGGLTVVITSNKNFKDESMMMG
jgi:hypothetical protein